MNYSLYFWSVVAWCVLAWTTGKVVNGTAKRPLINWQALAGGALVIAYAVEVILILDGRLSEPADRLVSHFLFFLLPGIALIVRGYKWRNSNPSRRVA